MTGRVVLVALGAVGALLGLALAGAGLVLLVLTGRGGSFGGGEATLSTPRYALVSDAAGLGSGRLEATVRVRVRSDRPVFVGVGPTAAVAAYLSGVAYDDLTGVRLSPLRATLVPSAGTGAPAAPGSRPLWTVRASGPGQQTVEARVGAGRQRLVVMNADGSAGVRVTASVALRAPFLRRLALGLLVTGAVVAPAGGVLLVAGVRRTVRAGAE